MPSGPLAFVELEVFERPRIAPEDALRGDELRDHDVRPLLLAEPAKNAVRDPGHRREVKRKTILEPAKHQAPTLPRPAAPARKNPGAWLTPGRRLLYPSEGIFPANNERTRLLGGRREAAGVTPEYRRVDGFVSSGGSRLDCDGRPGRAGACGSCGWIPTSFGMHGQARWRWRRWYAARLRAGVPLRSAIRSPGWMRSGGFTIG